MIFIIGSNGQLGCELVKGCRIRNLPFIAVDYPDIDITDTRSITASIGSETVSVVVNAAAYTAVDQAETDPKAAAAVNSDGAGNLARSCRERKIPLVHISTDYVFNGRGPHPYKEDDPVSPLGVYGETKASGEEKVRLNLSEHLIIRTAWLYGVNGNNFVKKMLEIGRREDKVRVVDDQIGSPTYAADLANAILDICERAGRSGKVNWGTYHYCGKDAMSWYDFAGLIFQSASRYETLAVKVVEPIPSSVFPSQANRPAFSVLDCTKIYQSFAIKPRHCKDSLDEMLAEYYKAK